MEASCPLSSVIYCDESDLWWSMADWVFKSDEKDGMENYPRNDVWWVYLFSLIFASDEQCWAVFVRRNLKATFETCETFQSPKLLLGDVHSSLRPSLIIINDASNPSKISQTIPKVESPPPQPAPKSSTSTRWSPHRLSLNLSKWKARFGNVLSPRVEKTKTQKIKLEIN